MKKEIPSQEIYDLIFQVLRHIDIIIYTNLYSPLNESDVSLNKLNNNKYILWIQIDQEPIIKYQFSLYKNMIKVTKEQLDTTHTYVLIYSTKKISSQNIQYWIYDNKVHILREINNPSSNQLHLIGGREYLSEIKEKHLEPYQIKNRLRKEETLHILLMMKDNQQIARLLITHQQDQDLTKKFPKVLKKIPTSSQKRINELGGPYEAKKR